MISKSNISGKTAPEMYSDWDKWLWRVFNGLRRPELEPEPRDWQDVIAQDREHEAWAALMDEEDHLCHLENDR